jgi:four helix bundle protein
MSGKIERFEDLSCWQSARELVKLVFIHSRQCELSHEWDMRSQAKRAALSSQNNIAEGFCRYYKKEFIRFLDIAQSSAGEIQIMCYNLEDVDYLPVEAIEEIRSKATDTRSRTLGLIRYLSTGRKTSDIIPAE